MGFVSQTLPRAAAINLPAQTVPRRGRREHRPFGSTDRRAGFFPAYLAIISAFVLPIAQAVWSNFPAFRCRPIRFARTAIGRQPYVVGTGAYLGGFSAATGMVIVETIALSTMICNEIVMRCCCGQSPRAASGQGPVPSGSKRSDVSRSCHHRLAYGYFAVHRARYLNPDGSIV